MADQFTERPNAPALVIGAAGIDLVGRLHGDLEFRTSNPAQIRTSYGGVARNVAENLARLGQPVKLLSVVGEDEAGDQLLGQAREAGVDVTHTLRSHKSPTGTYLAVINKKGELQFALDDMRAIRALSPAYLKKNASLFRNSSFVFLDNNLPDATLDTAITLAREANTPICADPTSNQLAPRLKPYFKDLSLITPNNIEVGILCGRKEDPHNQQDVLDSAKCLVSQGVGVVIVTMPYYGVCYADSQTSGQVPVIRTEIVDPTGAGDALTSAVLFGLLNGIELDESVRLGVTAASLTLRHTGAVFPDLTLEKLYDELVI